MSFIPRKILLHTGNILDIDEQIRKVGQSTSQELRGCVKWTLNAWTKGSGTAGSDTLLIRGEKKPVKVDRSTSNGLKTTIKVFLADNDGQKLLDAINSAMSDIDQRCIHSVIVAPPDVSDDVSLADIMPVWVALERAVETGTVTTIGIADISPALFKSLYEWARVKPSTIQVNLSSCCTVPEELTEFAKQNDVQIFTHNDQADILDEEVVGSILSRAGLTGVECQVLWVARHRTIQTCYGLLLDKGYALALRCGSED